MSERIELLIDIFDDIEQRAQILPDTTVQTLIREITNEFEDISSQNSYELLHKSSDNILDEQETIGHLATKLNFRERNEIEFRYKQKPTLRKPISENNNAVLVDSNTGTIFPLTWQPSIIGRRAGMSLPELLAVDLTYDINARRISRTHAQITEQNGEWYIERLTNENPTYLNTALVRYGDKAKLSDGDVIQPGRKAVKLTFQLEV